MPSGYGTGSGFAARNFSDDESSDSSDDDEIAHGISHHEKRLLRYEARLTRWNKRNPDHGGSFPSRELHLSDESSSVASSSDDTWVTDDSADEDTASVDPAFDRQRLQQRYSSALRRAGMRRSRPRSYASFVRMANRTIWNARNRTYFRLTGELSPSDFSIRIAGHIVTWTRRSSGHATSISDARCYASHGPGRSSHVRSGHRWLMDSGANNHMVTEESDCTSDITPLSGFITGVSVDIVGQGNCEIYVTTSSGESIPATIYGVKSPLIWLLGQMALSLGSSVSGRLSEMDALSYSALLRTLSASLMALIFPWIVKMDFTGYLLDSPPLAIPQLQLPAHLYPRR